MHFVDLLLDLVFSSACPLCKSSSRGALLCQSCAANLLSEGLHETREHEWQRQCKACGSFAHVADPKRQLCLYCLKHPMPLAQVRSIWGYGGVAEEAIKFFKYASSREIVRSLSMLGSPFLKSDPFFIHGSWDFLVPIPSTRVRLLERRFSHTGLLAQAFGRLLKLPVRYDLLLPGASHSPQAAHQTAKSRLKNIRGAFKAGRKAFGTNILLVDDILTSGATISEAAKTLLRAGANRVDGFTLARSSNFNRHRADC